MNASVQNAPAANPLADPQVKVQVHHPVRRGRRLFFFTSFALGLAGLNSWLFADLLLRLAQTAQGIPPPT